MLRTSRGSISMDNREATAISTEPARALTTAAEARPQTPSPAGTRGDRPTGVDQRLRRFDRRDRAVLEGSLQGNCMWRPEGKKWKRASHDRRDGSCGACSGSCECQTERNDERCHELEGKECPKLMNRGIGLPCGSTTFRGPHPRRSFRWRPRGSKSDDAESGRREQVRQHDGAGERNHLASGRPHRQQGRA